MRSSILFFLMFFLVQIISAQEVKNEIEGVVTFQTAQNIYVKFLSAGGIQKGDKIFIRKNGQLVPVILVENTSSVSCVGKALGDEKLKAGDKVIALVSKTDAAAEREIPREKPAPALQDTSKSPAGTTVNLLPARKEHIDGRIQVSSYSNFSSLPSGNNTRLRYIWSMNASNISNSRISLDSYISFSHKLDDWAAIQENIYNGLKIYDLNLRYEAGERTTLWLGRKINPKISSLGAIDGVQFEVNYKHFYWGAVTGFRPDYTDYSFNKDLFEYGAFVGHVLKNANGVMQTSLAGFNQTNSGNTDRRFVYIQHDNSILKNLNLFFSSEVDLYKIVDGVPINELTLTSLYMMLNYRISGKISISSSYDNRKNIIYYETYKNYIDVMLADATRQGVQLRINYRPITYLSVGAAASYWDRQGDSKPTRNFNSFLTYTQLPWLKASSSLTFNALHTSYVDGYIYGVRFDKNLLKGKLNWSLNYRYVDYTYLTSEDKLLEHIAGTDLSFRFTRKFSLSVNYEGTFEKENKYHQVYCSVIKRF
ncbi:MAG TPA: hypothetical protein VN249_04880 [Prolixibacteraceae bacterium]|nr:hypothetical protein [Prolixibacteraceae bacterium]